MEGALTATQLMEIEGGAVAGGLAAAEDEAVIAAEVFGFGGEGGEIEGAAEGAADDEGEFVDHFVGDGDGGFGVFGGEGEGAGLDLYSLGGGADFEGEVGTDAGGGVDDDAGDGGGSKAGAFDADGVATDVEAGGGEVTGGAGG
jgi:hypothetical protein